MNLWPSPSDLTGVTDHQLDRYAVATARPVGILGGSPGTGKTYLSARAIKAVVSQHGEDRVAVCAPTGKAAVRITEAMAKHGLSLQATTIHRLLGVQRNGHDGGGWGFRFHAGNLLPQAFLFVDEASMLGTNLAASFLAAVRRGGHVLFIGDFAQLPPVEHGAPLRDMIAAGIPYGELTEVHRNEGDIVRACRDLKEGRPLCPSPYVDLESGFNLWHLERRHARQSLAALSALMRDPPPGADPVWDMQVLCAVNEHGDLSRKALNAGLQKILNPEPEEANGDGGRKPRFRVNDKVICLTNGLLPVTECQICAAKNLPAEVEADDRGQRYHCLGCGREWKPLSLAGDFVANGEIGRVTRSAPGVAHVSFDSPRRTIRVAGEWLDSFDLAYAITTHKSQGSQWPVVVSMIDDSHGADRVSSYEWHRTAISRAEKLCITIGPLATIHRQCRKSALASRKTFLKELLSEGVPA